ncbi:MAG: O-antigen ligase family protein [Opitutales bacterium]
MPSTRAIRFEEKQLAPPVWRAYALGFLAVAILVLLGGAQPLYALAFSLLLPGTALLIHPPKRSPGVWIDRFAVALLLCFLLAFVPQFYWPDPQWRDAAEASFGMELPWGLSIQPMISFEAWVSALAGFAWFYAAASWPINHNGRKWLYVLVCLILALFAVLVCWGNPTAARYPAAEASQAFSLFPDQNQTANLLAVGGVFAFGYAMTSLRSRLLAPLVGFIASGLCLSALIRGVAPAGIYLFFAGLLLWYGLQLKSKATPRALKFGFPLVLLALTYCISGHDARSAGGHLTESITLSDGRAGEYRSSIVADTAAMIQDAPISGFGLGNFTAIFPQYREASMKHQSVIHPESDLLWLFAEAGLVGVLLFVGFLAAYAWRCRRLSRGQSGAYRLVALTAVILFIVHTLFDVPGHRPGTAYFAILFAALAVPRAKFERPAFPPLVWRMMGGVLVCFALVWLTAGLSGLPLHSTKAIERHERRIEDRVAVADYENGLKAIDKWLGWKPFDWRAHFQHAVLTLSDTGSRDAAAAAFSRARFVEPTQAMPTYEEGLVWLPYERGRTLSAWQETLLREMEDPDATFGRMIDAAGQYPDLLDGLSRISKMDTDYRFLFLVSQDAERIMLELDRELSNDPTLSKYSRSQRTQILENWIVYGDRLRAENFITEHEYALKRPWWLRSLLWKEEAKFEKAVHYIREGAPVPQMPVAKPTSEPMALKVREFTVAPADIVKGTALLQIYIQQRDFASILEVTDAMIEASQHVPPYVTYWKAESLYQLQDYIESWYVFDAYCRQMW